MILTPLEAKMTNEQINVAIAEACGWRDFVNHPEFGILAIEPDCHGLRTPIQDYCNDLNAMHEAEKMLRAIQWHDYALHLDEGCWHWALIHAPARQRAEAFLRTLGKWEEALE